ncbi:MAG: hypothetical protein ACRBCK_01665 [Alphaproteobacteria bacterium]
MSMKRHKKLILLGSCLSITAIAFTSAVSNKGIFGGIFSVERNAEVNLKNFSAGTEVSYKILIDDQLVKTGEEIIREDGQAYLPTPTDVVDKEEANVTYQLRMVNPDTTGEPLDLSLNFDAGKGGLSVKGDGVNEFSDITLKRENGEEEKVSADWSGMFISEARRSGIDEKDVDNKTIELAFQNADIFKSDLGQYSPGKVEVFFGDGSGSNTSRVQSRYSWALARMTEELSAVMVLQTEAIGMFFDASIQLRTQRKVQELQARAHKDYHPSEQMCRIGTFMRSVAHTESKAELNKHALNRVLMNQYLAVQNSSADGGPITYERSEVYEYIQNFCDRRDNDGAVIAICSDTTPPSRTKMERMNKDIDYTRTLATQLTLDINFSDFFTPAPGIGILSNDEEDIIALAKNLYFPNSFEVPNDEELSTDIRAHYNSRSYAAKMNVAHNTFLNIVGMKTSAPEGRQTTATAISPVPPPQMQFPRTTTPPVLTEDAGWAYMKALLLREFDIADSNNNASVLDEIDEILGERPSYYAQMEVLTKKIYQHPNFYTNLYDKPVNVDRIGASIDAITIMHQRDRFDSMLRTEMLTALLVENGLRPHVEEVNTLIYEGMQNIQKR